MTNYYTNKKTTAEEFFNTVCKNYINHGEKIGEKIVHVLLWNLSISALDVLHIAKENGYNVKLYKSRTLVIIL